MQHGMLRARTWSAREAEIRLEPGSEEAWPAAQMPRQYVFLHAVFSACHTIQFPVCMPHGL